MRRSLLTLLAARASLAGTQRPIAAWRALAAPTGAAQAQGAGQP